MRGRSARLALRARAQGFEPRGMGEEILRSKGHAGRLGRAAHAAGDLLQARCQDRLHFAGIRERELG
jgi:hypothetical protein